MLREPSGTTRSGSISCVNPRPWQAGQAPCGRVEAEDARLDLRQRDAAVDAGELLAEGERGLVVAGELDVDEAVGEGGGGLDGVGEPPPQAVLHDEPVDDHGDVVLELLVELDVFVELAHLAVDLDAREAVGAELLEELAVLALAAAHDRRDHAEARARLELAAPGRRSAATLCPSMGRPHCGQCGWPTRA